MSDDTPGLRQPSEHGYWMHREDESRCEPSQITSRLRPSADDWWWCTEHQSHLEWIDTTPAPAPPGGDDGAAAADLILLAMVHATDEGREFLTPAYDDALALVAARDAALAEAARARAETEVLRTRQAIDQGAAIAYRDKYRDALAESARLAAALGRVEGLLPTMCVSCRTCGLGCAADLRAALSDAGTDEGRP